MSSEMRISFKNNFEHGVPSTEDLLQKDDVLTMFIQVHWATLNFVALIFIIKYQLLFRPRFETLLNQHSEIELLLQ